MLLPQSTNVDVIPERGEALPLVANELVTESENAGLDSWRPVLFQLQDSFLDSLTLFPQIPMPSELD